METQVRTPQMVFMQPQRLVVPLFQRPYVWNEENQWQPLWDDVVRVAERVLSRPADKHQPHFLGAVVLQQVQKQTGQMQERTIIDGQQRLPADGRYREITIRARWRGKKLKVRARKGYYARLRVPNAQTD